MDISSAAALSASMSMASLQQKAGIEVLAKSMDVAKASNDGLIQMMNQSVNPHLGGRLDVRV